MTNPTDFHEAGNGKAHVSDHGWEGDLKAPNIIRTVKPYLITGGAGFIGSNLADSLLQDGHEVMILDNLSRHGVANNLHWLSSRHGDRVHAAIADIRDADIVKEACRDAFAVVHLAAQTAVTTSMVDPLGDFETNARGTLNVLEGIRCAGNGTPLVFASTNKVYGDLQHLTVGPVDNRYLPRDEGFRQYGIAEEHPLHLETPYGCSKGAADQYVLEYARTFDIHACVLRMSCIYGPRQFGTEDQGWVAHFILSALNDEPIVIFGDGMQVRDILEVGDAVTAYRLVLQNIEQTRGRAFNLGGGTQNAVSLKQVLQEIETLSRHPCRITHEQWRKGDQPYFVADTRALAEQTHWQPMIPWRIGVQRLFQWLSQEGLQLRTPALRQRMTP